MVSSLVSPALPVVGPTCYAPREPKILLTCNDLLTSKLWQLWRSTQVSHRGSYSVERLLALGEYTRTTSRTRVFLVCFGTPLPMMAFVLAQECIPLQDPNDGWKANYGIWIRGAIVGGMIAFTVLIELQHLIEGVTISLRQTMLILAFVVAGYAILCMAIAADLAFPIPFMSISMVPPLLVLVAVSFRIVVGARDFKRILAHPTQLWKFLFFICAQALTLVIYPVYQVLFNGVADTAYELPVLLLLPIVKSITRNMVAASIGHMEDMIPEGVILTVDFFNAVYMATFMQRTSASAGIVLIMCFDVLHTILALRSMHQNASDIQIGLIHELGVVSNHLRLLDVGCSLCRVSALFEKQDRSHIQLRSCLRHELSPVGISILSQLERIPLKHVVRFRRSATANINSLIINISVKPEGGASIVSRESNEQKIRSSRTLRRILEILFTSEYLVLTEYLESFIPIVYSIFLCVMIRLPSAKYHTELDGVTRENVDTTVQVIFVYGLLECASFLALVIANQHNYGMRTLYHLSFVLETQMSLIQSKLTVWMLLTLTCRVAHYALDAIYAGFDFTFHFGWVH